MKLVSGVWKAEVYYILILEKSTSSYLYAINVSLLVSKWCDIWNWKWSINYGNEKWY